MFNNGPSNEVTLKDQCTLILFSVLCTVVWYQQKTKVHLTLHFFTKYFTSHNFRQGNKFSIDIIH